MSRKVYVKPPKPTRTMLIAQIILGVLFLPLGGLMPLILSEGDARPFAAIFSLIWVVACIAIIVAAVKGLRLVRKGKIEIAEVEGTVGELEIGESESGFAARLRDLEGLKREGLISDGEYRKKRAEIMKEKW